MSAAPQSGRIYLVGAGPGDPGLLTLKGRIALERADAVIYDYLANPQLLRFCRADAELLCVGKHAAGPQTPQEEIVRLLIAKAREGKVVVRLKGGDPYVFGRGGEEAEELASAGILFEVVPGVTAGHAVPAYAGIPVTHRNHASMVHFVTGHEDPSKAEPDIDWAKVAQTDGTLVFFMGVKRLGKITATLIAHGRAAHEPAALIRWGTYPRQEVVTGTLGNLAQRTEGMMPPAVIVVGDVVRLREKLNWYEHLPLFGKRIAITRTREQARALYEPLAEWGAQVIEIPTIEIRPPASWEPLDSAIRRLEEFDFLLVTSVNGVKNFLARLDACGRDLRALHGLEIGAIGPATAAEFARTGIKVDFIPPEYRAEGLLEVLGQRELQGKAFLIPRAKVARDIVPKTLEARGARVEVVVAYETVTPEMSPDEISRLFTPPLDAITFTSSSTVSNFCKIMGAGRAAELLRGAAVASIGPITSETARKSGLTVTVEAQESTMAGLVEALLGYFVSR
jgi:uroporphyrinogen III methyltransferase / synthase